MKSFRRNNAVVFCCVLLCSWSAFAVNWDKATLSGTTPKNKMFFNLGEDIIFTIRVEGVDEIIPDGQYFIDWERRGDDGRVEKGRTPLPLPENGLVIRTKMDVPGFVCLEANVIKKDGTRVRKKHKWEPRVFFQGGACVEIEAIQGGKEPSDYDTFWKGALKELEGVPMNASVREWPIPDKELSLYSVSIACAGPRPVTAWMKIPKDVESGKKYPIFVTYRGASHDNFYPPTQGDHDRISFEPTVQGFDLGKDDAYVANFFRSICRDGLEYGFSPEDLQDRNTSYWKWVVLRAVRALQWVTTRTEWNGRGLTLVGGSQGAWQALHAAAHFPAVKRMMLNMSWGGDWTGQAEVKNRLRGEYRPKCWFPDMAYFDTVFAARRIRCPVMMSGGLGDYVATPCSQAAIYNGLRVPKKLTFRQGCTHGWNPAGAPTETLDGGYDRWEVASRKCKDPIGFIKDALASGEKKIVLPKAQYWLTPKIGELSYLLLEGLDGVTIDFGGSEFVGTYRTTMLRTLSCTNCVFRNLTIDYATLPFTQGIITKVDADKNWDVEIVDGYPLPDSCPLGSFWPIQAYGKDTHELVNPMRYRNGIRIDKTGPRTYRITGGENRTGQVGDIAVWTLREAVGTYYGGSHYAQDCKECRFEDITEYSTPTGCAFCDYYGDAETYLRCKIIRRPLDEDLFPRAMRRLRSGSHDANMHRGAIRGPRIIDCVSKYHCDDCVNVGGHFSVVTRQRGNVARVLFSYLGPKIIEEGDVCEAVDGNKNRLPDVKTLRVGKPERFTEEDREILRNTARLWPGLIESCKTAVEIEFDRPIGIGGFVISKRHQGNGFLVRGCDFGHTRARGIVFCASNGSIVSNTINTVWDAQAVEAGPSFLWLEGGFSENTYYDGNNFEKPARYKEK